MWAFPARTEIPVLETLRPGWFNDWRAGSLTTLTENLPDLLIEIFQS
jgi:hypothetical protein